MELPFLGMHETSCTLKTEESQRPKTELREPPTLQELNQH